MKLRTGYLISGITTGLIVLFSFIWTLPDGMLHIVFCDVGQGDAAYVRFPDGRDMIIDGGPSDAAAVSCLGRHMPFWDRHIDIVALTHPQKDHMQGLLSVFKRFRVDYFVHSDIANTTDGYASLMDTVHTYDVQERYMTQDDRITLGATSLSFIWPTTSQIAKMRHSSDMSAGQASSSVLGASVDSELNDGSLVFALQYGAFDAVFTGDADSHVEPQYVGHQSGLKYPVEVIKVPHHGSKTGMTQDFIGWIKPEVAVISVGKNSYGHPSKEAVNMLQSVNSRVLRTDEEGDIEVVSDGKNWNVIKK